MSQTVCYEQPLNERVRALLRLEYLFQQVDHAIGSPSAWDTRVALQGLFDILALSGRNEFKRELLKELDRHVMTLGRLRQMSEVDTATLDRVLVEIGGAIKQIHCQDHQMQEAIRQTDFLSVARARSHVPGGSCQFDVPALHHWLASDHSARVRHLRGWLTPFDPMRAAITLTLRLIRDSATPKPEIAVQGFFQRTLDSGAPHQLIRVFIPAGRPCFPEISGGKHRFTIRFLDQPDPNVRAVQSTADVAFELACCAI
ncbi:MAG: cell division protein ZapD [Candidatus Competibacteraceae bacterium]|nr:cell division protein ZapD [Candidatus Competibacteraceae bacterium]